jgi:alpha-galactosidase
MKQALVNTGRPIFYSINAYGINRYEAPYLWAPGIADMWRIGGDSYNCFDCPGLPAYNSSVTSSIDNDASLSHYAGPGRWNDPDMLEVGVTSTLDNGYPVPGTTNLTNDEATTQFSMWAMLAAPLIAGNDLASMNSETRAILTNRAVIAVDQDPLGAQATRIRVDGDLEVWVKPLANGDRAVVLLNRSASPAQMQTSVQEIGMPAATVYTAENLWAGHGQFVTGGDISATVAAHGVAMFRVHASGTQQ